MSDQILYPYPVLGNSKDVYGSYLPNLSINLGPDEISLNIGFGLSNEYYLGLIKNEKAQYLVDVSCNKTYFRKVYTSFEHKLDIVIPASLLKDRVEVSFYICATQPMDDYSPVSGSGAYSIGKGDILGTGGVASFIADKEFDPLQSPTHSLIKIAGSKRIKNNMMVVYDNDSSITIELPEEIHKLYKSNCKSSVEMIHAGIVLPVLMEAIMDIDQYSNTTWATKIKEICNARNIDIEDDPLIVAQKILSDPVSRMLRRREKDKEDGE